MPADYLLGNYRHSFGPPPLPVRESIDVLVAKAQIEIREEPWTPSQTFMRVATHIAKKHAPALKERCIVYLSQFRLFSWLKAKLPSQEYLIEQHGPIDHNLITKDQLLQLPCPQLRAVLELSRLFSMTQASKLFLNKGKNEAYLLSSWNDIFEGRYDRECFREQYTRNLDDFALPPPYPPPSYNDLFPPPEYEKLLRPN